MYVKICALLPFHVTGVILPLALKPSANEDEILTRKLYIALELATVLDKG